jgi:hypothetical protein
MSIKLLVCFLGDWLDLQLQICPPATKGKEAVNSSIIRSGNPRTLLQRLVSVHISWKVCWHSNSLIGFELVHLLLVVVVSLVVLLTTSWRIGFLNSLKWLKRCKYSPCWLVFHYENQTANWLNVQVVVWEPHPTLVQTHTPFESSLML